MFIQNVKNKKNIMFSLLIFVLAIAIAGVGGTLAFLTKNTEKRANNFTFGNISIELTEEEWEKLPPEDKIIYPEKTISKDPVITNTGKNDAYVYMEVRVPRAKVRTYNSDGSINAADMQDLFTFVVEQNSNWKLLGESVVDNNYNVYLYVYEEKLPPTKSTPALFDEVQVISMVEGELKMDSSIEMPITAYAIQSEYVTEFLNNDKDFKAAFNQYIKEN